MHSALEILSLALRSQEMKELILISLLSNGELWGLQNNKLWPLNGLKEVASSGFSNFLRSRSAISL